MRCKRDDCLPGNTFSRAARVHQTGVVPARQMDHLWDPEAGSLEGGERGEEENALGGRR